MGHFWYKLPVESPWISRSQSVTCWSLYLVCVRVNSSNLPYLRICVFAYLRICLFAYLRICVFAYLRICMDYWVCSFGCNSRELVKVVYYRVPAAQQYTNPRRKNAETKQNIIVHFLLNLLLDFLNGHTFLLLIIECTGFLYNQHKILS